MDEKSVKLLKSKVTATSLKELDKAVSWVVHACLSTLKPKKIVFLVTSNKGRSFDAFYPKNCHPSLFSDESLFIYLRLHSQIIIRREIPRILEDNFQDRKLLKKIELKLKGLNIDAVIPLFLDNQIYGLFLLGSKKLNEAYAKDDFEILENFQANVSNALIGAILYKEAIERTVSGEYGG